MRVKERHFLICNDIFFLIKSLIDEAKFRAQEWGNTKNKAKYD